MPNVQHADTDLGREISTAKYNAERLNPDPSQDFYLHLSDLRLALEDIHTKAGTMILDYGCGGSPYASLFPNAEYKRADYLQSGGLDYVLGADSRVPEQDAVFDTIFSTQVLEHVERPEVYLSECYRLLKPGGRVILSTHGTFPEHGCPYDYQRWTADGLRIAFEKAGFRVTTLRKLTTGPRALFFLLESSIRMLCTARSGFFVFVLLWMRALLARGRRWIHRACDYHFADCRVVDHGATPDHPLFIGLFIGAEKI